MHSLNKYLLSTHQAPGTLLGTRGSHWASGYKWSRGLTQFRAAELRRIQWKAGVGSHPTALRGPGAPHLGSDPPWVCGPEKGWLHLSGSSRLICKTRPVLTQFEALWGRISVQHSGLVFIFPVPDGFYMLIAVLLPSFGNCIFIL